MLVLAHTDRFRIDFYQFRERILQAARDGNRTANGYVQIRKFFCCVFRCRVNRGAGFAHDYRAGFNFWVTFQYIFGEFFSLARCGAVANCDQSNIMFVAQVNQNSFGFCNFIQRWSRVHHTVIQHLTGCIHNCHFHTGTHTRVEADSGFLSCWCGEQQIFQVGCKYFDCFFFGFFAQFAEQIRFQMG